MAGGGGRDEGKALAPAAAEEQMLGGWHLAESSQMLITALNC